MKKLILAFLVVSIIFVGATASAKTMREMKEDGTLLGGFVLLVLGGVYVSFVILAMVAGATEKKVSNSRSRSTSKRRSKRSTRTKRRKEKPSWANPRPVPQNYATRRSPNREVANY
jgi:hypothetical protein